MNTLVIYDSTGVVLSRMSEWATELTDELFMWGIYPKENGLKKLMLLMKFMFWLLQTTKDIKSVILEVKLKQIWYWEKAGNWGRIKLTRNYNKIELLL